MHPEFLGQGSVTLPEKWEAIRGLQTHFLFCHVSHCTMGSKSLYFPLKWSSILSDRLTTPLLSAPITRILVKGISHVQLNQET